MDDRFFFNPYGFGMPIPNIPPNLTVTPNLNIPSNNSTNDISAKEFYENQYYYYRYLNEFMDYQIKSREYLNIQNPNNQNNKTN